MKTQQTIFTYTAKQIRRMIKPDRVVILRYNGTSYVFNILSLSPLIIIRGQKQYHITDTKEAVQ